MSACPRTILAVEDSADEIFFLQNAFEQLGYGNRVHFARDGAEAVDYISGLGVFADRTRFPVPCIVLTDLKMPVMDGFQLLNWLRKESVCKDVPAFMFTSSDLPSDFDMALRCGVNGFFRKPTAGTTLVSALKQIEASWLPYLTSCHGGNQCPFDRHSGHR